MDDELLPLTTLATLPTLPHLYLSSFGGVRNYTDDAKIKIQDRRVILFLCTV